MQNTANTGSGESALASTSAGIPIADNRKSLTMGPAGPVLLSDVALIEKNAAFNRERIPERVVHALGAGAHGFFENTASSIMPRICKAKLFREQGRVPIFTRFSLVAAERGGSSLQRDPRGFAVKFFTSEGNWDLVANNMPVFWIRDGMLFPDLNHSQKRDPKSDLHDADAFYDFLASTPEAVHAYLMVFGDRGIPYSFRTMHGFANHTFRVVSAEGATHYVKFHLKSEQGVKNFSSKAAEEMSGRDPDFARRELFEHIASGGTAAWKVCVQVLTEEEAARCEVNIMDVTKVLPQGRYPLHEVGRIVLNRNVDSFFSEVEQAAFSPANLIPGIEASNDRLLQARMFAYNDAQRYRIGGNFNQLPINCPYMAKTWGNQQRDGVMAYYNSSRKRVPAVAGREGEGGVPVADATTGRYDQGGGDEDFKQPRVLYEHVMTNSERERLAQNIGAHLQGASERTQSRFFNVLECVSSRLRASVQEAMAVGASPNAAATAAKVPSARPLGMREAGVKAREAMVGLAGEGEAQQ